MQIHNLKRFIVPKVALLATGLAAAAMVVTLNPLPAQAFPGGHALYSTTDAPAPKAETTTTALAVSPLSGAAPSYATLTATVDSKRHTAAGRVEFFRHGNSLGVLGVPVTDGVATLEVSLIPGTYTFFAKFIPTDATAFTPSTSTTVTVVVDQTWTSTTRTTLYGVSSASAVAPADATLTASVYEGMWAGVAAGTMEFFSGTNSLGTSPVIDSKATLGLSDLAAGTYSFTAKFIPADPTLFTPSTSNAVAFVVTAG